MSAWQATRERLARLCPSPLFRFVLVVLVVALILGLGANMVSRVHRGSSDFPMARTFSDQVVRYGLDVHEIWPQAGTHTKYPPFFFVLLAPIAVLPLTVSAITWYLLSVVLVGVSAWLGTLAVRPRDAHPPPWVRVVAPIALAFVLVVTNLAIGQVNVLVLAWICGALFLASREWNFAAGVALSVAVAIKLTPALFIVWFAWKRAWHVVGGALVGLVVCWGVLPVLVLGPERALSHTLQWGQVIAGYVREGTKAEDEDGIAGHRHTNQSLSAAAHRFFTRVPARRAEGERGPLYVNVARRDPDDGAVDAAVKAVSFLLLLLLGWLTRGRWADDGPLTRGLEASLVLLLMLVISPITWTTHMVAVLLPYAAALEVFRRRAASDKARRRLQGALLLSCLLLSLIFLPIVEALSLPLLGVLVLGGALALARRAMPRTHGPS